MGLGGATAWMWWLVEDHFSHLPPLVPSSMRLHAQRTPPTMPAVEPQPADAPRSQHASLAAALPLVLPTLCCSSQLSRLHLVFPATDGAADAARISDLWQRAWQHTLPALRQLLESSAPLRQLHLELPACLEAPTAAYLPQLQAATELAPLAVRRHVLLALHPRAGRCSLLQLLPLGVLREVLDLAAPLQPCTLHISTVQAAGAAPAGAPAPAAAAAAVPG